MFLVEGQDVGVCDVLDRIGLPAAVVLLVTFWKQVFGDLEVLDGSGGRHSAFHFVKHYSVVREFGRDL